MKKIFFTIIFLTLSFTNLFFLSSGVANAESIDFSTDAVYSIDTSKRIHMLDNEQLLASPPYAKTISTIGTDLTEHNNIGLYGDKIYHMVNGVLSVVDTNGNVQKITLDNYVYYPEIAGTAVSKDGKIAFVQRTSTTNVRVGYVNESDIDSTTKTLTATYIDFTIPSSMFYAGNGDFAFDGNDNLWVVNYDSNQSYITQFSFSKEAMVKQLPLKLMPGSPISINGVSVSPVNIGGIAFASNGTPILSNGTPIYYTIDLDTAYISAFENDGIPSTDLASSNMPTFNEVIPKLETATNPENGSQVFQKDTIEYTTKITTDLASNIATSGSQVTFTLPEYTTYKPNSVKINGVSISDANLSVISNLSDTKSVVESGFKVHSDGLSEGIIGVGKTATITFELAVDEDCPTGIREFNGSVIFSSDTNEDLKGTFSNSYDILKNNLAITTQDKEIYWGNAWKNSDLFVSATNKDGTNLTLDKLNVDTSNVKDAIGSYNVDFYAADSTGNNIYYSKTAANLTINDNPINLNANGGTVQNSEGNAVGTNTLTNNKIGDTVSLPTPTRENYTFLYWQKDSDASKTYTDRILVPEAGTSLTAVWQANGTVITKYVDENNATVASSVTQTGRSGDSYTTNAPIITGYALKTKPDNAAGVYPTADTITVTYVYKAIIPEAVTKGTVKTNYVDQDGVEIATSTSQTGRIGDAYSTVAGDNISGYALDLDKLPSNATGTYLADTKDADGNTVSGVTVTYVYNKINDESVAKGTVKTKYVNDAGTEIATATSQIGRVGDTYTTSAATISGYALKTTPDNATGTYLADTKDADGNTVSGVTVTYVYTKITNPAGTSGTVTTKYVNEAGTEIATATTQTGRVGDAYTTTAATVSGYALKTSPTNISGTYTEADITVTYIYKKVDAATTEQGNVVTKYVDGDGVSIALNDEQTGRVGDTYATTAKTVSGYALVTTPDNATGAFTLDDITVTYVYKKITAETITEGNVTAKYEDEEGKTLDTEVTQTGRVGDAYATTAKTISGYALETIPNNATGTYTKADITVTYVYKKVGSPTTENGKVITKYVDQDNKEIATATTQAGRIGDTYSTNAINVSGYILETTPNNATGTYTEADITVTYVYKKVENPATENGKVTTKYVDQDGKEIATAAEQTGRVGDAYVTSGIAIENYALDETQLPENATGTFTKADITVTYVYKKVTTPAVENGKVITKYVDEDGKEIAPVTEQTGRVDDTYVTSGITIENYALKTTPENATGTFTKADITVTYVYKKAATPAVGNGRVITKYVVNKDNKEIATFADSDSTEIAPAKEQTGRVGDAYATSGMVIDGYALDETQLPENAKGTFTEADITVTYVYKKVTNPAVENGKVITKYVDEDGKEIATAAEQTGRVGDTYGTSGIAIDGYALDENKLPKNATGTYTEADVTVTYVYKKVASPIVENGKVVIKYVDEDGKEIATAAEQTGRVGDTYETSGIAIDGYTLDKEKLPENATGTYTTADITVTYVYKKVTSTISGSKGSVSTNGITNRTNLPSTGGSVTNTTTQKSLPQTGERPSTYLILLGLVFLGFVAYVGVERNKEIR